MRSIYLTVLIILSLSTVCSASETVELEIRPSCTPEGRLILSVENPSATVVNTENITINVSYGFLNIWNVTGSWNKRRVYNDESDSKMYAIFTSDKGVLKYEGDYTIFIDYPNREKKPIYYKYGIDLKGCKGYKYDCNISNITIRDCYNEDEKFHFVLEGLNKDQAERISPVYDVVYEFGGHNYKRNIGYLRNDTYIQETGVDVYYGNFPTSVNIIQIGLYVVKCGLTSKVINKDCRTVNKSQDINEIEKEKKTVNNSFEATYEKEEKEIVNKTVKVENTVKRFSIKEAIINWFRRLF